jgi:hypothetical protein
MDRVGDLFSMPGWAGPSFEYQVRSTFEISQIEFDVNERAQNVEMGIRFFDLFAFGVMRSVLLFSFNRNPYATGALISRKT